VHGELQGRVEPVQKLNVGVEEVLAAKERVEKGYVMVLKLRTIKGFFPEMV
jgi:hypothetical protein